MVKPSAIPTLTMMMGTGYLEHTVPHLVKNLVSSNSNAAPHVSINVNLYSFSSSGGGVGEPRTGLYKLSSSDLAKMKFFVVNAGNYRNHPGPMRLNIDTAKQHRGFVGKLKFHPLSKDTISINILQSKDLCSENDLLNLKKLVNVICRDVGRYLGET